jgi:hypothetical protein
MGLYKIEKNGEVEQVAAGKVDYKDMVTALMEISEADKDIYAEVISYYEDNTACMDVTTSDGSFYKGYVYL